MPCPKSQSVYNSGTCAPLPRAALHIQMATLRTRNKRDTSDDNASPLSLSDKTSLDTGARQGAASSWARLIFYWIVAIAIATHLHYKLPSPKQHRGVDPDTGMTEFSEYNALETISYLSDTLGYRKYLSSMQKVKRLLTFISHRHCGNCGGSTNIQILGKLGTQLQTRSTRHSWCTQV